MTFSDLLLWPGTKICERMGVNPEDDAGLIRSMFNMIIYISVGLATVWMIMS